MFVGSDIAKLLGRLQSELEAAFNVISTVKNYANRLAQKNNELELEVSGCLEGIRDRDEEIEDLHRAVSRQEGLIDELAHKVNTLNNKFGILELEQLVLTYKSSLSEGDYTRLLNKASVVRGLVTEIQECLTSSLKN